VSKGKDVRTIPFVDLWPQYETLKAEIDAAIAEVIRTSAFIQGKAVREFEKALAESVGSPYAVGVANATSALWMTLRAMGIGPGDEVITTVHTAVCTAESIALTGAKIVFVDIDPKTYQMSVDAVQEAITRRTKAIVAVHLYGIPVDMMRLLEVAHKYKVPVVEDCAQAQGAEVRGRRVGSLGIAGTFSFFPSKNLGAMGDAGAVVTKDERIERYARMFSNHGRLEKYLHEIQGSNERLDTLQAAILKVKLPHLDEWNAKRRRIAAVYAGHLPRHHGVVIPEVYPDTTPVWHLYVVRVPRRQELMTFLKERGVGTGLHYPLPLHLQPSMSTGYKEGDFPEAEKATQDILSLPMYPHMTEEDAVYVCEQIADFYARETASH
jgi:dTDP-4-amino-4,6-dideoxygalactose transaminase